LLITFMASELKFGVHLLRGIPREAVKRNTPILGTTFHAADIADTNSLLQMGTRTCRVDMTKPARRNITNSVFQTLRRVGN